MPGSLGELFGHRYHTQPTAGQARTQLPGVSLKCFQIRLSADCVFANLLEFPELRPPGFILETMGTCGFRNSSVHSISIARPMAQEDRATDGVLDSHVRDPCEPRVLLGVAQEQTKCIYPSLSCCALLLSRIHSHWPPLLCFSNVIGIIWHLSPWGSVQAVGQKAGLNASHSCLSFRPSRP